MYTFCIEIVSRMPCGMITNMVKVACFICNSVDTDRQGNDYWKKALLWRGYRTRD